jgi:hypothetical protein
METTWSPREREILAIQASEELEQQASIRHRTIGPIDGRLSKRRQHSDAIDEDTPGAHFLSGLEQQAVGGIPANEFDARQGFAGSGRSLNQDVIGAGNTAV